MPDTEKKQKEGFFSTLEYEWTSPITEYVLLTVESLAEQLYGSQHGILVERGSRVDTFKISCPKSGQQEAITKKLSEMFTDGDPEVIARTWEHINKKIILRDAEQENLIKGMLVGTICEAEINTLRIKYESMFQHLTSSNVAAIAEQLWDSEAATHVAARLRKNGLDSIADPELTEKAKEFFRQKLLDSSRPGQI